jgi:hypothetical protein
MDILLQLSAPDSSQHWQGRRRLWIRIDSPANDDPAGIAVRAAAMLLKCY